ncbi:MAG: FAD-binding oxidoreductase, partial [Chloroflexales bacterium]|nr:FAD-binding oxidoreductase [Chloroflexales bacterium]
MAIETLQRQLAEVVGAPNLSEDTDLFAIGGRAPALAVAPGSVEELAQAVAACHAARVAVVPWGGGTRQSWGRPPAAERFVVIRTTRLGRVLVYEPDDLTISVEAGMTLAALDEALAANGQMLPLDGPRPERSTIGGILATAADGPRRLGYGTARDLLIGAQVVEATGRVSKAGGMVVKNVSGFDMMKLYLGSMGTLAIIVSANFKLLPRPRAAGSVSCLFRRPEGALALAERVAASQLTPAAVEYHEGWALDGSGAPVVSLEVRAEGLPAAVERHLRDL